MWYNFSYLLLTMVQSRSMHIAVSLYLWGFVYCSTLFEILTVQNVIITIWHHQCEVIFQCDVTVYIMTSSMWCHILHNNINVKSLFTSWHHQCDVTLYSMISFMWCHLLHHNINSVMSLFTVWYHLRGVTFYMMTSSVWCHFLHYIINVMSLLHYDIINVMPNLIRKIICKMAWFT